MDPRRGCRDREAFSMRISMLLKQAVDSQRYVSAYLLKVQDSRDKNMEKAVDLLENISRVASAIEIELSRGNAQSDAELVRSKKRDEATQKDVVRAEGREARREVREFLVLVVSVLAFLAASFAAYYSKQQLDVFAGQLSEMRAEQRPWIYADIKIAGPITYDVNGMNIPLSFILHNKGHLPAIHVITLPKAVNRTLGVDPKAEQHKMCDPLRKNSSASIRLGATIFPDQEVSPELSTVILRASEIHDPDHVGATFPVIVGCIDYQLNVGDDHHQTGFIIDLSRRRANRPGIAFAFDVDDGTVPADEIIIDSSFEGDGFYAD